MFEIDNTPTNLLLYQGVGHFEQRLAAALGGFRARKRKRNGKKSKLEVFERKKMVFLLRVMPTERKQSCCRTNEGKSSCKRT